MEEVVQVVIYRKLANKVEFLLLKRIKAEGGFWQNVTGHIEDGETALDALKRELHEETGITKWLDISNQIFEYSWEYKGTRGKDVAFAINVAHDQKIKLNSAEHEQYFWLSSKDAVGKLKWPGNKKALQIASQYIKQNSL